MSYFLRLPQIVYNGNDCIDLHKKLILVSDLQTDWIASYDLKDGETLHDVSYQLYNTVDYWWLLSIVNNFDDIHYDKLIKDDILQKLAKQLQVMELSSKIDYILFPPKCKIRYEINGKQYTGTVIKKYIFNVAGEGSKFLIDVLLDDINSPMPTNTDIEILNSTITKLNVENNGVYLNGDLVRQDLYYLGKLDNFARGIIIYKDNQDIYVDKTKIEDFTITNTSYEFNGKLLTGQTLTLSKKNYVGTFNITNVEKIEVFSVNEFGLRDLYYLYRYDKLVEINNIKGKIIVIKPEYLDVLKNNLIIIEEEE